MGLLGGLMGIASETDANKIEREFVKHMTAREYA